MYPLHVAEYLERASEIRMRASADDDTGVFECDEPFSEPSERATLAPPAAPETARKGDPSESLNEVLFRIACGDHQGAVTAASALMDRVPVILMTKEQLRPEPLGYWELHLLGRIDAMSTIAELIDDSEVPAADVVRVVCELAERKIIALR